MKKLLYIIPVAVFIFGTWIISEWWSDDIRMKNDPNSVSCYCEPVKQIGDNLIVVEDLNTGGEVQNTK